MQATSIDRFLLGRKGDDLVLFFPSAATPGWFPRPLQWDLWAFRCVCKVSKSSILLARTDHLQRVLFSRFHAPGKQPGDVRLVSIQMIMMRIFARPVVHQQELLLLLLSSLFWTCRRSIAVLWPLNLRQVASLIRSKSLPWSDSCQVSSPLFHRQSPCPPLPPRISLNFLLVRIRQAELWFTLKHVTEKLVNALAV